MSASGKPIWMDMGWPNYNTWSSAGKPNTPFSSYLRGVGELSGGGEFAGLGQAPMQTKEQIMTQAGPRLGQAANIASNAYFNRDKIQADLQQEANTKLAGLGKLPDLPNVSEEVITDPIKNVAGTAVETLTKGVEQSFGQPFTVPRPGGPAVEGASVGQVSGTLIQDIEPLEKFQEGVESQLEQVPVAGQVLGLGSELLIPTTPLDIVLAGTKLGTLGDLQDLARVTKLTSRLAQSGIERGGDILTGFGRQMAGIQPGVSTFGAGLPIDGGDIGRFVQNPKAMQEALNTADDVGKQNILRSTVEGLKQSGMPQREIIKFLGDNDLLDDAAMDTVDDVFKAPPIQTAPTINKTEGDQARTVFTHSPSGSRLETRFNPKDNSVHLVDVTVPDEFQRQGIGTNLYREAFGDIAQKHGPDTLVTGDLNSEAAVRLREKLPGSKFYDQSGKEITPDEAAKLASEGKGPTVTTPAKAFQEQVLETATRTNARRITTPGMGGKPKGKRDARKLVGQYKKQQELAARTITDIGEDISGLSPQQIRSRATQIIYDQSRGLQSSPENSLEDLTKGIVSPESAKEVKKTSRAGRTYSSESSGEPTTGPKMSVIKDGGKVPPDKAFVAQASGKGGGDGPKIPAGGTPMDLLGPYFEANKIPDVIQAVVNDFVKVRTGLIADIATPKNAADKAIRSVAAAVSGEHTDKALDEISRLEHEATLILGLGDLSTQLRRGEIIDPGQLYDRAKSVAHQMALQVARNIYTNEADYLEIADFIKRTSAMQNRSAGVMELQQAIKSIHLGLDLSVFGQQILAGIRRGNSAVIAGALNDLAIRHMKDVSNPLFFDAYKAVHPERAVYFANRGLVVSGDDLQQAARDFKKLTEGASSNFATDTVRKIQGVNEALTDLQYGKVLAGMRIKAAEGLFWQSKVLHDILKKVPGLKNIAEQFNIENPSVAFKLTQQANMIGSAARGAGTQRRRAMETFFVLTPGMTRAQIAEMGSLFDITTGAGMLNTVNTLTSWSAYTGVMMGFHGLLGGVNEWTFDPESYDFGKIVDPSGRVWDFMPQASFYKALRRAVNRGDPAGIMKAGVELGTGRLNIIPGAATTMSGIGYAKEGGFIEQMLPRDSTALEFGWIGDNEWDDPLTWEQKLGSVIPFPPLSIAQAVGNLRDAPEAVADDPLAGIMGGLTDVVASILGQQEYQENTFGAVTRIAKSKYGASKFSELDFDRQIRVVDEVREQGGEIDRGTLMQIHNKARYDTTWETLRALANNPNAGQTLQWAAEYDDISDWKDAIRRDLAGMPEQAIEQEINELDNRLNREFKALNGKDLLQQGREYVIQAIEQDPSIGRAIVSYRQEMGQSPAAPEWLQEAYFEITGMDILTEEIEF